MAVLKTNTSRLVIYIKPFSLFFFFSVVRSCSSLSAPHYGFIYPHMCTSFPVSGTVCYFECRHGFLGNGGTTTILCGNDGKWSKNESSILRCLGKHFVKYMSQDILCMLHHLKFYSKCIITILKYRF